MDLEERLAERGRVLAERESKHIAAMVRARSVADRLHEIAASGLISYHLEIAAAPQLDVNIGAVKYDDKHLRAFEFDVHRGRHRAIVVVKSRGDVTLVGPFQVGQDEGPCRRFPFADDGVVSTELSAALGDMLDAFLDEATAL